MEITNDDHEKQVNNKGTTIIIMSVDAEEKSFADSEHPMPKNGFATVKRSESMTNFSPDH